MTKELKRKLDLMHTLQVDMMQRLKILEAALAIQNKKIRELTKADSE